VLGSNAEGLNAVTWTMWPSHYTVNTVWEPKSGTNMGATANM